jgi:hypothetical protein
VLMMSPAAPRSTASGLMIERVRCNVFMIEFFSLSLGEVV